MKSIFRFTSIIILLFIFNMDGLRAQGKFELSPLVGYQFGGTLKTYQGDLKIDNQMDYGIAASSEVALDTRVEFIWTQMQTHAEYKPYYGYEELRTEFDVNVNYYQLGGVREFPNGSIVPFGSFTLGAVQFTPGESNINISEFWSFSIALGGGVKIWLSDKIGIRLQGRLLMPLYFQGISLYAGTGGAGMGVGAGVPILQGDFLGGLIFAFGD